MKWTFRCLLWFVLALCSFTVAIQSERSRLEPSWSGILATGGYLATHVGDDVEFYARRNVHITLQTGYWVADQFPVMAGVVFHWRSTGDDRYRIDISPDAYIDVKVLHSTPLIDSSVPALFFLLAFVCAVYGSRSFFDLGTSLKLPIDHSRQMERIGIFATVFVLLLLIPSYMHNDELGQGFVRNWGYLAWGYGDVARELIPTLINRGISGLCDLQSLGKPYGVPAIVALVHLILPLNGAIVVVSGTLMAAVTLCLWEFALYCGYSRLAAYAVTALFLGQPVILGYATSLYQEIGYLAVLLISALCIVGGSRRCSNRRIIVGIVIGSLAVITKHPLIMPEFLVSLGLLLVMGRVTFALAVRSVVSVGLLSIFATFAFWPFLWKNVGFRLPFVLGARFQFDKVAAASHQFSLLNQGMHVVYESVVRENPILLMAMTASLIFTLCDKRTLMALLGVFSALLYVTPTTQYQPYYELYAAPFIALLGARVIDAVQQKRFAVSVAFAGLLYPVLYLPYPSVAVLGCVDFGCAEKRMHVAEPVYGMKEAAAWISEHVPSNEPVSALAAPHALQNYLPNHVVDLLSVYGPDAQKAVQLAGADPKYIVENPWSRAEGESLSSTATKLVWESPISSGRTAIYENSLYRERAVTSPVDADELQAFSSAFPDNERVFIDTPSGILARQATHAELVNLNPTEISYNLDEIFANGQASALFVNRQDLPSLVTRIGKIRLTNKLGTLYVLPGLEDLQVYQSADKANGDTFLRLVLVKGVGTVKDTDLNCAALTGPPIVLRWLDATTRIGLIEQKCRIESHVAYKLFHVNVAYDDANKVKTISGFTSMLASQSRSR